jgi:hypothetical protein
VVSKLKTKFILERIGDVFKIDGKQSFTVHDGQELVGLSGRNLVKVRLTYPYWRDGTGNCKIVQSFNGSLLPKKTP